MYDYRMIKSIHDQRMRQFMIEAERAHLLRQLRKNRRPESSLGWLGSVVEAMRRMLRRRLQPAM